MQSLVSVALAVTAVGAFGCSGDPDGSPEDSGYIVTSFEADLSLPNDLVIDPETGVVYVSDFGHYQVRAISPDRSIATIAGTGNLGSPVDGPAVAADFSHIGDLLLDGSGGLYVAAWHNSLVMRVELATGALTKIAGQGTRTQYSGDSGPATEAQLSLPAALALTADGTLLVADQENQVVRAIDPASGLIDRFAGRCVVEPAGSCATPVACPDSEKLACDVAACSYPCTPGFTDDVDRADVRFGFPFGAQAMPAAKLALAPDGTIYVADAGNHRIRAIRPDGRVVTVAGGGSETSDGVAATSASIPDPYDVATAADGTLYVVDTYESCVRRVDLDGTIWTVAGICGQSGFAGDGGRATEALLDRPLGIAIDERTHRLYIADSGNDRIRDVTLPR
jgi:DNA-binding beta-propeller fold protein YncE